jgi:Trk-type K+ transport system membrane component
VFESISMPQLPLIIPIIVTGLLVGSALKNRDQRISRKRLGAVSVLSGVLNGAQAYLVTFISPQTTFTRPTTFTGQATFFQTSATVAASFRQTSELVFAISSVLLGILIPLVIVGIALVLSRGSREEEDVELQESTLEK